jgi:SAM-dependent methyltransferase
MIIDHALLQKQLSSAVELDSYLVEVARREPSHGFLAGATQGCYLRLVDLLVSVLRQKNLDPTQVSVLDWGAGKGHISYLLREAGFQVTSCDLRSGADDSSFSQSTPILDEQMIKVVPLEHEYRLPFPDGGFDLVVSFGVLEHVTNDRESLKEIRRVLKPGGLFFFCFLPNWLSWTQRLAHLRGNYYHPVLYSKDGVRNLAQAADFELDSVWHGQLFPKNALPNSNVIEYVDRFLTNWTPLKYFATNLEGLMVAR